MIMPFHSKLLKFGVAVACGGVTFAFSKDDMHHQLSYLNPFKSVFAATTESKYSNWDANWDRRAHEKPKASRHFILIRHGQYNLNGKTDAEKKLTKLGQEQSIYTGQRLKSLGLDTKITRILESTMTRATETCRLICKQLDNDSIPLESSDLLREGAPIEPEPPVVHWAPEPQAFFVDGARIETAFREFIHRADVEQEKDSVEVIVCHANVIRYFVCRALQFPPEAWLRMSLRHASITLLTVRPNGRVSLKAFGDSGHFPADKLTFE